MRCAGVTMLLCVLAFAVARAADDNPGDEPEKLENLKAKRKAEQKEEPKKERPRLEPEKLKPEKKPGDDEPAKEGTPEDSKAKELLGRVAKNMESAEDRLKKRDPGDQTRDIQRDIIKDLDELIKKQQQSQQQQSQSMQSVKRSKSQSASSKSSQGSKTGLGAQSGSKKTPGGQQTAKNQGGKDEKPDKGDKGKDQQAAKGNEKGPGNNGGGGKDSDKKSTSGDLKINRDVWGHLPEARRMEMDAYAREQFMQRYEELLRQYYRSISEQGRRKGE